MDTASRIEAVLFYTGEPATAAELSKILGTPMEEIREGIETLKGRRSGGICLVAAGDEIALRTAPDCTALIESLRRAELSRDLGRAGLETLSIVLYKGPLSRAEIDYIRGVNSAFIVRNLLVRGLINRAETKTRTPLYIATIDLLGHLGISKIEDLPEYEAVRVALNAAAEPEEQSSDPTPQHAGEF